MARHFGRRGCLTLRPALSAAATPTLGGLMRRAILGLTLAAVLGVPAAASADGSAWVDGAVTRYRSDFWDESALKIDISGTPGLPGTFDVSDSHSKTFAGPG